MKGIGLVFAGGGGKGAYQIGVWKCLREYGLDQYIRGVSGTSVGALNAALFASGSYENAERLWMNIEPQQILSPRKLSPEDVMEWIVTLSRMAAASDAIKGFFEGVLSGAKQPFVSALLTMVGRRYGFSRDGLLQLMQEGIDFSALQGSPYPCFATCLEVPELKIRRFDLRDYTSEDAKTIMLASSAIPMVFELVDFDGQAYCDGGLPLIGDNVPIDPIYEMGVEHIIVVNLSQNPAIDCSIYPDSTVLEVVPSTDLGKLLDGTMDFTARGARWRIEQGYQDAKHILDPFVQMTVTQYQVGKRLEKLAHDEHKFHKNMQSIYQERSALKDELNTLLGGTKI